METELSPKFTEMKTGERASRFGRPQRPAQPEINSIPTEVSKFIPKHSPKRLKPKADLDSSFTEEKTENQSSEVEVVSVNQDIPSHNKENLEGAEPKEAEKEDIEPTTAEKDDVSLDDPTDQKKVADTSKNSLNMTLEEIMDEGLKPEPNETIDEDNNKSDGHEDLNEEDNHEATENHSDSVSDTDSALGSAASCSDPKDEEVALGQVLWGGSNQTNWWPCIVYPIDETGAFITGKNPVQYILSKILKLIIFRSRKGEESPCQVFQLVQQRKQRVSAYAKHL